MERGATVRTAQELAAAARWDRIRSQGTGTSNDGTVGRMVAIDVFAIASGLQGGGWRDVAGDGANSLKAELKIGWRVACGVEFYM